VTQDPTYREIGEADIPELFAVRTATDENRLTLDELHALGITVASVAERLAGTCKGWLCEADERVVGFAIGDWATGEMWVIAVLPEYVGRGIGSVLLESVERWLQASGCRQLWLTTDTDDGLRAHRFYIAHGWRDDRVADGVLYMAKDLPPYAVPAIGEAVRVFDGTRWGKTVPGAYLGFERVADGFFMHRVRSDAGLESAVASYDVYRLHARPDGEYWESLTPKPRVR
jgi:GNAT superfamily N-acetyltransferase